MMSQPSPSPPPPPPPPLDQQQPVLLLHQLVAMVHVYRRILIRSIGFPIAMVVVPILFRVVYHVLTKCIGQTDDRYVILTIVTTAVLAHILSSKFQSLQSYLHSFPTLKSNQQQQNSSATASTSSSSLTERSTAKVAVVATTTGIEHTLSSKNGTPPPTTTKEDEVSKVTNVNKTEHHQPESSKENIDNSSGKNVMKVTFQEGEHHSSSKTNTTPLQDMKTPNSSLHNRNNFGTTTKMSDTTPAATPMTPTIPAATTTPMSAAATDSTNTFTPVAMTNTTTLQQEKEEKSLRNTSIIDLDWNTGTTGTATGSSSWSGRRTVSFMVFALVCMFTRYLSASNTGSSTRSSSESPLPYFSSTLLPSYITTIRFSICMIIYAAMVAVRFFGPTSIMRISVFPLVSNPWDRAIQNWFHELRKSLIFHSYPTTTTFSDPTQQMPQTYQNGKYHTSISLVQLQQQQQIKVGIAQEGGEIKIFGGRRYARPTIYATVQHFLIALISSIAVAYVGIFPYTTTNDDNDDIRIYIRSIHMTSCIFTTFGSVISILDGTSHEINPYLYTNRDSQVWFHTFCNNIGSRVLCTIAIVPILSLILTWYMIQLDIGLSFSNYVILFLRLLRNCTFMSLYLYAYDEMIRTSLFYPRPNISNLMYQLNQEASSSVTRLAAILNSVLCDPSLVQQIVDMSYSITAGKTYGFEKEELHSSAKLMKQMALVLLSPGYKYMTTEAPLEEDVFRFIVLEAFGGGGGGYGNKVSPTSERHQRLINEWMDRSTSRSKPAKTMVEPVSSALLRGLCAYVGGCGEALSTICAQTLLSPSDEQQLCKFTMATFCSSELGVVAIARSIIRSLTSSSTGRTLSDWKCSHLSIQIPSALVAIYKLRCGVVEYSRLVNPDVPSRSHDATGTTNIGVHLVKEHEQVVVTCDSAALSILQSMKSLHGSGRIDITVLDRDCREWKNVLMAQSTSKS